MKLAIISDIHGNSVALMAVIEDFLSRNIEDAIFLGDFAFKGPEPQEVMNLLKDINLICCLKGNTDKFLEEIDDDWEPTNEAEAILYDFYIYMRNNLKVKELEFIKSLPEKQSIRLEKLNILCVHGSPRSIDEVLKPNSSDEEFIKILKDIDETIILSGHAHLQFIRQIGNKTIINPGAIGVCNLDKDDRASYAILDIFDDKFNVEFVKVNYNYEKATDIAVINDFPHLGLYKKLIRS